MRALPLSLLALAAPASAHEFWISPLDYTPAAGEEAAADLRNGEEFEGGALSYIPQRTERFEIWRGGAPAAVEGRVGDRPALAPQALEEGLNVVVHETADNFVTYRELARFARFANHKGFPEAVDRHVQRRLPEDEVIERYRRFAKSLIGVGDAEGADAPVGMRVELVALANPYVDDVSDGMPVRLLRDGAPVADWQVELFQRLDGAVEITLHRTDADGVALLPVAPGAEVMADAVLIEALDPATAPRGAQWETLWANLTFAVPE